MRRLRKCVRLDDRCCDRRVAIKGAQSVTRTASVSEVVLQRRRNLSSLMVTTQHGSSQYISQDVRRPGSLIFQSPPLPPDPFPAAPRPSVSPLVTGGYTHGCVCPLNAALNNYGSTTTDTRTFNI